MPHQNKILGYIFCLCMPLILFACSNNVDYTPPAGNTDIAITHYSFGKIVIDGETYTSDMVIASGEKVSSWSFDYESHYIDPHNIKPHITENAKEMIIGIGYNSAASMSSESLQFIKDLKAKGILVQILSTSEAVKLFNISDKTELLAFFHLNC